MTFVFKILFPAFWIVGFCAGTLAMWMVPVGDSKNSPVLIFTVGWLVGSLVLGRLATALKAIWLDGEWPWVANLRRKIHVPLQDVESVDEFRFLSIHPIVLYLSRKTEFGDRIVFMPKGPGVPFASHGLVGELRKLAKQARQCGGHGG